MADKFHDDGLDVSVVVVSYNVRELVCRCLDSIDAATYGLTVEQVVVDNASTDGSVELIETRHPDVRLIASDRNLGFGAANNLGFRQVRGRFVLLLNPDAELRPGALETLVAFLDRHPDVGVVGPRLRFPDGSVQPSRRRFPTLATLLIESAAPSRWWDGWPALRRFYVADRPDDQTQDVDWLVGAALLIRREALEGIGGFDERFFMYSEELDLARRIRERGWRLVYHPAAEVVHHEGKSSEQNLARRAMLFNESKARYAAKWAGADVGRALRLYLLLNTLYDLAAESAKLILGYKPALRRARVAALLRVVRFQARRLGG